jgi:hypothetical protein
MAQSDTLSESSSRSRCSDPFGVAGRKKRATINQRRDNSDKGARATNCGGLLLQRGRKAKNDFSISKTSKAGGK